jgi:hypothetical protein
MRIVGSTARNLEEPTRENICTLIFWKKLPDDHGLANNGYLTEVALSGLPH